VSSFTGVNDSYRQAAIAVSASNSLEYQAFAKATSDLRSAQMQADQNFSKLVSAAQVNRKLWSILASDVADERNLLPHDARRMIFSLAAFVSLETRRLIFRKVNAATLIEINMIVMRGLKQEVE
jgi:flagellar protein FlaF